MRQVLAALSQHSAAKEAHVAWLGSPEDWQSERTVLHEAAVASEVRGMARPWDRRAEKAMIAAFEKYILKIWKNYGELFEDGVWKIIADEAVRGNKSV